MPTKEEVEDAWNNKKPLNIDINEECLLCWKKSYWEILLIKIPEMVEICLDCVEKNPDNKKYEWKDWWRLVWQIWKGILSKDK